MARFFVTFKLQGHTIHETFVTPLDYVLGLNPMIVRDESGEALVWGGELTKKGAATCNSLYAPDNSRNSEQLLNT